MKFLSKILVHPDSQIPIMMDWQDKVLDMEDGARYRVGFEQGVPYVLPVDSSIESSAKVHIDHGTGFDYQNHYQRDAEVFDYFQEFTNRVDRTEKTRLEEMIVSKIPDSAKTILDVGCGNGWLSRAMVSYDITVISMDISSRNPVKALHQNPHPHHEALIADVYHLPLKEGSIDCIVASEIMEHVPDPALFIKKLLFVLKPGGKLIITTPYDEQIQYHLCVHCNRPTPGHAHLHSFNEENIERLIPQGVRSWNWSVFSHKYMSKSRVYVLMKGLPFGVWNGLDKMANKVWRRPMRLLIEIVK